MNESYTVYENIYFVIGIGTFILLAVFWISFARISMARIEREIISDGKVPPGQWDGLGARVHFYCHAVVLPLNLVKRIDNPIFNYSLAREYARKGDRVLGLLFFLSALAFILCVFIGWLFDIY